MKKLIMLFVLCIGVMSVSNTEKTNSEDFIIKCCTAYITYNGEPAHQISKCAGGNDQFAQDLACHRAAEAARAYIASQQAQITEN